MLDIDKLLDVNLLPGLLLCHVCLCTVVLLDTTALCRLDKILSFATRYRSSFGFGWLPRKYVMLMSDSCSSSSFNYSCRLYSSTTFRSDSAPSYCSIIFDATFTWHLGARPNMTTGTDLGASQPGCPSGNCGLPLY